MPTPHLGTALVTLSSHLQPGREQEMGINEMSSISARAQGRDEAGLEHPPAAQGSGNPGQAEPQEEDETGDIQFSWRGKHKKVKFCL